MRSEMIFLLIYSLISKERRTVYLNINRQGKCCKNEQSGLIVEVDYLAVEKCISDPTPIFKNTILSIFWRRRAHFKHKIKSVFLDI